MNTPQPLQQDSAAPGPVKPDGSACLTHHAEHCDPPWLAIHRNSALELLKDYDLTDAQKTDIGAMMAGYCNLLEYAGLLYYGQTEAEAAAKALGLAWPNDRTERPGP